MRRKESSSINSIRMSGRRTKKIARKISAPLTCGRVPGDVRRAPPQKKRASPPTKGPKGRAVYKSYHKFLAEKRYAPDAVSFRRGRGCWRLRLKRRPLLAREGRRGIACQCSRRRIHACRTRTVIAARPPLPPPFSLGVSYRRCCVLACVVRLVSMVGSWRFVAEQERQ